MGSRLELQALLESITERAYFQPPTNTKMVYPCILYALESDKTQHAGNRRYLHTKRYQVTVIDRNPDSVLPDVVGELPLCSFDRAYVAEQLHHHVFTLFF